MAIKKKETRGVGTRYRRGLVVAGDLISALTASSCCILALALSSVGVSGAWIGNFAQLVFVAATIAFLGTGYWLIDRPSKLACGAACAPALPNRLVTADLILATVSSMYRLLGLAPALAVALIVFPASADKPTFPIKASELAAKLNDVMRAKNLSHRAVEIECAATHATTCQYRVGKTVVLMAVAASLDAPIWNVVAIHTAKDASRKQALTAIAVYAVLLEVLSPRSDLKKRSTVLANLISGLSSKQQEAQAELDGVTYQMKTVDAGEVWLFASPTQ